MSEEIFDEAESTSAAQAAANRDAIANRQDRQAEHLRAAIPHMAPDDAEAARARLAEVEGGGAAEGSSEPAQAGDGEGAEE